MSLPQPQKRNPVAALSLICGFLAFIPFVGLLAIVLGVIGLAKTRDPLVGRRGAAKAGIALGCLGVVLSVPIIYFYVMLNHTAQRGRTGSNLHQIGLAINEYANDNATRFPPDLGTLAKIQHLLPADFLCPSMPGGSSLPSNLDQMTVDEKADWINRNADVAYLGKSLTSSSPSDAIVLYEKHDERSSPPDGSFNEYEVQMLFADGHIEDVPAADARIRINRQTAQSIAPSNSR